VIIDLPKFLAGERGTWTELEQTLKRLEDAPETRLDLDATRRLYYLYQRTAADLARVQTFAAEPEIRRYLEALVLRAYGEIHETRERSGRLRPWLWLTRTFPQTFRRHLAPFWLSVAVTRAGCLFGGIVVAVDPDAKEAVMPFSNLLDDPARRVAREESAADDRLAGKKATFSAALMQNNIRVSILALALGMTWGVGTLVLLFSNGVILGAVAVDYALAGQSTFLLGWLLPHGVVEIPAILLAGQAGFLLARALLGRGDRLPLPVRLRRIGPDLMTLIAGVGVMLVWAGIVEAFLSQYHEPVLPYAFKIAFGLAELVLLVWFLSRAGTRGQTQASSETEPHAR
jgi:uncharacterized membrane protein SpoIIM required for sporulation